MRRKPSILALVLLAAACAPALSTAAAVSPIPAPSAQAHPEAESAAHEADFRASPDSAARTDIPSGENVQDLDVSPSGNPVAILVEGKDGTSAIRLWDRASPATERAWEVPAGVKAKSIAWHPGKRALFLLGRKAKTSVILEVAQGKQGWASRTVYETPDTLRRLVAGPRPFVTGEYGSAPEYRVFFGRKDPEGGFSIRSVTESGRKVYQVVGKASGISRQQEEYELPSDMVSPSALPVGFHPAGHLLVWEDAKSCFEIAEYGSKAWSKSEPWLQGAECGGTITVAPNGMTLFHWRPGVAGVEAVMMGGKRRTRQAAGVTFAFTPSSAPDGKGLVGMVRNGNAQSVVYEPVDVPLADVVNAWMFTETEDDLARFAGTGSVFRNTDHAQMYQLYETENYGCDGYAGSVPTRPYLVTTDAFWEVFGAAFEGLFVVGEKQAAIPEFWEFVQAATDHYRTQPSGGYWGRVFASLASFRFKDFRQEEAMRIDLAEGLLESRVLGRKVDYGILKPRGNYASGPEFAAYFKAFMYLTRCASEGLTPAQEQELERLPSAVKEKALRWIDPYRVFIAASRSPLVWKPSLFKAPGYVRHPESAAKLFPLSWAIDNEVLNSTVYHPNWPEAEIIRGPRGGRMLASVLDLPAALGNPLALVQSRVDIAAYPNFGKVLHDLGSRTLPGATDDAGLYDRWMRALAVQWSASPALPRNRGDWKSWDAKRLQTGLASWATLRHATVLVNETSGAECGEGGYEEIVLRPPRGYVEPDTATFSAIAGLFDAAASRVRRIALSSEASGAKPRIEEDSVYALRKGLMNRLRESAAAARAFAAMAAKELRGRALADSEYDAVLTVGRVAEHHFLVYKSLSTSGLGLANPEPMPKIADVAKGPDGSPYLFAAVGHPLEWNQVVPHFGRREIVKGAVYSFYAFSSDTLFNDKEWQARLSKSGRPAWISPYIGGKSLACPARKPF
jgi:hypothetical protein